MRIIVHDFGTISIRTYLFDIGDDIRHVASATAEYRRYTSDDGGAEQDQKGYKEYRE